MAESIYVPMTGQARDALIAMSVLWVLFASTVFFRLLGRFRGAGIGADDVLSFAALVMASSTIGMSAGVFVAGVGHHLGLPEDTPILYVNLPYIMQITFAFTLVYLWTLASLKLSQLFLYNRVFSGQLKHWINTGIALVVLWGLIFTFVFIFLCNPIKLQWSLAERAGKCMDQILVLKSLIMTNIITDIYIFILPIRAVWKLQMRKTEKFAVLACFALGLACVIISIVRFWQIFVINLLGDLTGTSLTTFMLCAIELMLAGLCINIPMFRPFYLRWRNKHRSTQASRGKATYGSSRSRSGLPGGSSSNAEQGHTAWIELNDKDHETSNDDDGNSQRKLTHGKSDVITVTQDWSVVVAESRAGALAHSVGDHLKAIIPDPNLSPIDGWVGRRPGTPEDLSAWATKT
ncbi:hypothetical protein Q7P37_001453 [Cladosporium fusiforme]